MTVYRNILFENFICSLTMEISETYFTTVIKYNILDGQVLDCDDDFHSSFTVL